MGATEVSTVAVSGIVVGDGSDLIDSSRAIRSRETVKGTNTLREGRSLEGAESVDRCLESTIREDVSTGLDSGVKRNLVCFIQVEVLSCNQNPIFFQTLSLVLKVKPISTGCVNWKNIHRYSRERNFFILSFNPVCRSEHIYEVQPQVINKTY